MGNAALANRKHGRSWSTRARLTAVFAMVALLASTFVALQPAASASAAGSPCGATINAIVCENSKTGTDPSVWDIDGAGDSTIQGFATDISVNVGSKIDFKVDTDAKNYTVDIYRTGYYQGLGARKIASVTPSATLPQKQPQCISDVTTELYDCGTWGVSASWNVPSDAVSGVYIAKLTRTDTGGASHIIFIVRNDGNTSQVVFQTSDPTWQAYNTYGGSDFYQGAANGRAYKISYNRPIVTRGNVEGRDSYFSAEYATVRFMERNGYDMSYIAGVDTDRRGAELKNHSVFLSVGHDEYWSAAQRTNILAARDSGVNLQFLSGNEAYWHTRYENSVDGSNTAYRTLVSYKETWANNKIDPTSEWTGTWRDPRFADASTGGTLPENSVTGTMYMSNSDDLPVTVTSSQGKTRLWRGTSLTSMTGSSTALAEHTVGYESDEDVDNGYRPAGLIRLSTTIGATPEYLTDYGNTVVPGTTEHHVTLYKAASGALVFSAGSIQWGWGLDQEHDGDGAAADPRMQQAEVNLLADMGAQPGSLMSGLVAATKSTDTTAPTTVITSPTTNASVVSGSTVTVTGTAADVGGQVAGVEVSIDGGTTWHPATGTTAWSYTGVQSGAGTTVIKARAIDDSANFSTAGVSVTINVTGSSTIYGSATPVTASVTDTSAVEVGQQFTPDSDGTATGVRFYKGTANTGTHVGSLWNATTGARLATVTFTGETASGWQTASFATPVTLLAGTKYTVSYTAPKGGYAADARYWPYVAKTSSPLTVASGVGANAPGVYGTAGTMPASAYGETNYWVDVVFSKAASTPVRIVAQQPLASSSSNSTTDPISATLSRAVVQSSVSMTVTDASGAAAAGSVAFDANAKKVTFTPTAALQSGATYTVTVGATDLDGNTVAADAKSWTFTTAQPTLADGTCPCSLFSDSAKPIIAAAADTASVTVGTRFTTAEAGKITAIRFYKGSTNTGTHTGALWNADGTQLATVTFSNESSAGWQVGTLSTPVSIVPGVEYIASYVAPVGNYSVTAAQFTTAFTRGPLTAVANGGSYTYAGGFPKERSTSSYAVDVVFERPIPSPVLVSRTPDDGAVNVDANSTVSVTFDSPLASSTKLAVTAGGAAVAGSTALSSDAKTLTFTPSSAIASGTQVTASVTAIVGTNGGKTADISWTYTTAYASGEQVATMFSGLPTGAASSTDTGSIVLGMRFTPAVAGEVRAIRFYKSSANTGTHVGWLYGPGSSTPLATVTFSGETATGWQRAALSTPVELVAGQVYTVAYVAPNGGYTYQSNAFASAITNGPLSAPATNNGVYLSASSGLPTSSYNATNYFVDVEFVAFADAHENLFGYATPSVDAASETDPIEVGTAFTVAEAGKVTAIRFYKGAGNTGTHTGSLWAADGTRLATVTFTGETDNGWQRAALSTPVAISANTTYVVSYYAPVGHYSITPSLFTSPLVSGRITGITDQNGRFLYASGGGFPTGSWGGSAYYVDAEVTFASSSSTTATLTSTTPSAGSTVDAATASVTASVRSARTASIALTTGGASVAGTSTYSAATGVVTFTPASPLLAAATYTASVTTDGAALAGGTWTFTTKAPTLTASTPASGATNVDPATVKLTATIAGASSASFAVTSSGQAVAGTTALDPLTGIATFTPTGGWGYGVTYSATVTANGATLSNGSWSFTTIKKATLSAATPGAGTTVSPLTTTKITATLTDALTGSLAVSVGGVAVAGTSTFDATTKIATFTPTAALAWNTAYDVVATGNGTTATNGTYSFRTLAKTFEINSISASGGNDATPGNGICADASGACTLRAALGEANALGGDATVTVASSFAGGTISIPSCTSTYYMTPSGMGISSTSFAVSSAYFTVTAPRVTIDLQNKIGITSGDCSGGVTALYLNGASDTVKNVKALQSGTASVVIGTGGAGATLDTLNLTGLNYNLERAVVIASGANNVTIQNSTFASDITSGVGVIANASVSNLTIKSNTFTNDQSSTTCSSSNGKGCRYDGITAEASSTVNGLSITGNTFANFDSSGKSPIDFGAATVTAMSNLTITGNTFTNISNGSATGGATISLPLNRQLTGVNTISGNTFTGVKGSAAYAIYWDGNITTANATTASNLTITGNAFDGYGTSSNPSVRMQQAGSVTFEKNTFGSQSGGDTTAGSETSNTNTMFDNYDTSTNRQIGAWYPTGSVNAVACTYSLTLNPSTATAAKLPARVDIYWSAGTSTGAEQLISSQTVTTSTAQTITLPYTNGAAGSYRLQTIGAAPVTGGQTESSQYSRSLAVPAGGCNPAVTVQQAVGQADPSTSRTVSFTVTSSVPLATTGSGALATTDFATTGSTATNARVTAVTATSTTTYTITATADGAGKIILSLPAGVVASASNAAYTNTASTTTDNSITVK